MGQIDKRALPRTTNTAELMVLLSEIAETGNAPPETPLRVLNYATKASLIEGKTSTRTPLGLTQIGCEFYSRQLLSNHPQASAYNELVEAAA